MPKKKCRLSLEKEIQRVGQRIRRERTLRSMTLEDIACKVGSHRSNLCQIENSNTMPTVPTLIRIARAIGCCPSEFWLD